jgi:translocation protein SEC63
MSSYIYDSKVILLLIVLILQGTHYPFFFIVVLLLILIPISFEIIRYYFQNFTTSPAETCTCAPCTKKTKKFKRNKRRAYISLTFSIRLILLFGGWFTIINLGTTIYNSRERIQIWDPFHILEVSSFSSNAYIKKQYKRKSLKFHPDKRPTGMTKEQAEEKFISITKAYKAYFIFCYF